VTHLVPPKTSTNWTFNATNHSVISWTTTTQKWNQDPIGIHGIHRYILPLVHFYGINTSRWTYRSSLRMNPQRDGFGAPGHATISAKICSCSIALASLVSSSWQRWWRTTGCTEKTAGKQTQLLDLYHSYLLAFLISWTPFYPVHVHMNHASTHQFSDSLRNAPCFFVVSRFQTTQLFGENPLKVV